jgi:flavin reductase (DIM6/NTAB) family NADH-FMN oxidoreductase RutF
VPVSPDQFRSALRRWGSGVSVVTTERLGGIQGITVSSFCSLSLEPPLVLICISRRTGSHRLIEEHRAFAVNILRDDQKAISDRAAGLAGPQGNWLDDLPHRRFATGAPVLSDCLAWLDCAVEAAHDGGDHTIFVGRVEAAGQADGGPLLYFDGAYRRLGRAIGGRSRRA